MKSEMQLKQHMLRDTERATHTRHTNTYINSESNICTTKPTQYFKTCNVAFLVLMKHNRGPNQPSTRLFAIAFV